MSMRWRMLAIVLATRMSMGLQYQAAPAVGPLLQPDLALTFSQLGLVIGIYLAPGVVFALPGGLLGRRFGERRLVVPIGLGLATALLPVVATATSWRVALIATALAALAGAVLIGLLYRDAPRAEASRSEAAVRMTSREVALAASAGLAWGLFNACPAVLAAFGQELLIARGVGISEAGAVVSLAIWVTMISVPLGGVLADRLKRPNLVVVLGTIAAAVATAVLPAMGRPGLGFAIVGLTIGIAPGAIMAMLPKAIRAEVLTTGLGVLYTAFYVVMAVAQPAAGRVREIAGTPAAPVLFAALLMLATLFGLLVFRTVERRPRS
jgi:MFS family permease